MTWFAAAAAIAAIIKYQHAIAQAVEHGDAVHAVGNVAGIAVQNKHNCLPTRWHKLGV